MDTRKARLKQSIVEELEEARRRTRHLLTSVSEEDLATQHGPTMSPLIWDYGHIGYYEELWLLQSLLGRDPTSEEINEIYDASQYSRSERPDLDLLDWAGAERFLDKVRREAVAALENLPDEEFENGSDLTQAGFVYLMVLQHEHQHNETMLQTLQLMRTQLGYRPEPGIEFPENHSDHPDGEMVFVPGGRFTMGTDEASFAFDNERPAHPRHLPGFSAFPYPEYSEVFFNEDYKVLRGGSWATRPAAIRNTFRNWDHPIRRQLFVGFRCAR